MIAAQTATQAAEPAPRRDLGGKLLLTGIDWTDDHQGAVWAALGLVLALGVVLEQVMP